MTMDVLAEVLSIGQLGSKVVCQPKLAKPWGLHFSTQQKAMLHFVLGGICWIKPTKTTPAIRLMKGDIVFLTNNLWHGLTSDQELETVNYLDFDFQENRLKQDVNCCDITRIFCTSYKLDGDMAQPFFTLLPKFIHISAEEIQNDPQLDRLLQLLVAENTTEKIGHSVATSRLIDVLLVYVIRHWIGINDSDDSNWLTALQDPKLGPAIELIHKHPNQKWDVDKLSKTVFMSRSAFSKRFTESTGSSPGVYVVRWRMDLAAKLLRDTHKPIQTIANEVGYESETSFSKTFKKYRDISPVQYRKIQAQHDDSPS